MPGTAARVMGTRRVQVGAADGRLVERHEAPFLGSSYRRLPKSERRSAAHPPVLRTRRRQGQPAPPQSHPQTPCSTTLPGSPCGTPTLQRSAGSSPKRSDMTFAKQSLCADSLEDGRLRFDNNSSERELRKNWLFFGSEDHAQAAANVLFLVARCQLHVSTPELYLAELIYVAGR